MSTPKLADGTLTRFLEYGRDAGNWSGQPLVGGNVGGDASDKGFILNMKKVALITTFVDASFVWMDFTDKGLELLHEHDINTNW